MEFVANGLEGTRMETISTAAGVNKSLIYRHFNNKDFLYREVLRRAYEKVRRAEAELDLPAEPLAALDSIVSFTLRYYIEHPDFLVLIGVENLNLGVHLAQIDREALDVKGLVARYQRIIDEGKAKGVFRDGLDPIDLYMVVASQCWFTVATVHTFGITFEMDVLCDENIRHREKLIRDIARRYVSVSLP